LTKFANWCEAENWLQEEIAQNAYLSNQVEVLKTQMESVGLEPAFVEQADDSDVSPQQLPCHHLLPGVVLAQSWVFV